MPRKILLADDSVTAQNMGRRILSEAGYEVITVNNGSAALKKIAEFKPDLVILDVYMPGYGGLEVCQRMKEAMETLAIPVLLTVGKLEPFRADEARRVHADAHLVKPFEATELLAALTKLEDKIVPRNQPEEGKNTIAGRKSSSPRRADFGDTMNGWKSRLGIPSAAPKHQEPAEPEVAPAQSPATGFRNFSHSSEAAEISVENAPGMAASIYNGMVQDITAEEIAAIAAAAAAFGEKTEAAESETFGGAAAAEEPAAATIPAVEAEDAYASATNSASFAAVIEEAPAVDSAAENIAEENLPHAEPMPDADVVAALDSLAPAAGYMAGGSRSEQPAEQYVPWREEVAVGAVAASGPRWVAEEIALADGEGSLLLEREMQEVVARLADADDGRPSAEAIAAEASGSKESSSWEDSRVTHEEPISAVAQAEHSGTENHETPVSAQPESVMEAMAVSSDGGNEPELVAETIAWRSAVAWSEEHPRSQTEEVPAPSFHDDAEPGRVASAESRTEPTAGEAATVEATPVEASPADAIADDRQDAAASAEAPAVEATIEATNQETQQSTTGEAVATERSEATAEETKSEAAFAAAAAVGSGFRSINAIGSGSPSEANASAMETAPEEPSEAAVMSASATPATPEREAELAAAWAQWRQIRETIGNAAPSPAANHAAEGASADSASGANGIPQDASPAPAESSTADEPSEPSDPSSIASIVDSMLAELRPKLVAEIAKKMGKQK